MIEIKKYIINIKMNCGQTREKYRRISILNKLEKISYVTSFLKTRLSLCRRKRTYSHIVTYTSIIKRIKTLKRLLFSTKLHFQVASLLSLPDNASFVRFYPERPGYFLITSIRTISMRSSDSAESGHAESGSTSLTT